MCRIERACAPAGKNLELRARVSPAIQCTAPRQGLPLVVYGTVAELVECLMCSSESIGLGKPRVESAESFSEEGGAAQVQSV